MLKLQVVGGTGKGVVDITRCIHCNTTLQMVYKDEAILYTVPHNKELEKVKKIRGRAKYCPFCGSKIGAPQILPWYKSGTVLRHLKTWDNFLHKTGREDGVVPPFEGRAECEGRAVTIHDWRESNE